MFLQEAVVKLLALDLPCLTPGSVSSIVITRSSGDDALDASIKAAIQASAPYPMPSDPDARREARSVTSTFRAQ